MTIFGTARRGRTAAALEDATHLACLQELDRSHGARSCRSCGCTDNFACPGGCSWAGPDLCSSCA